MYIQFVHVYTVCTCVYSLYMCIQFAHVYTDVGFIVTHRSLPSSICTCAGVLLSSMCIRMPTYETHL